jgi:shikimate kinase
MNDGKIFCVKSTLNPSERNIVLIGMCGVGKSTVGVLLAKALGRHFLDTDVYIQAVEDRSLQQIIDEVGINTFCEIEQKHIMRIDVSNTVIATGGSVVYSPKAMQHLADNGIIVHLDLDYQTVEQRVTDLYTRGVVMEAGQSLRSLHQSRQPLYQKYAQLTVDCARKNHEQIVEEIISALSC